MTPLATYRLQFHKGFRFADAASLAPYLAQLGISHVYASPYLKARPGSPHGYDIVDHRSLNPELGDQVDFDRMVAAFAEHAIGQILDFVPNHIGVGGADNPLWLDVLEWGQESVYAGWFDIDWKPDHAYLRAKLLVPLLGEQYGIALEAGNLAIKFDRDSGDFAVWAYDRHKLPICPLHYGRILGDAHPELERMGDTFAGLPDWRPQIVRRAGDLKAELGRLARDDDTVQQAIDAAVSQLNSDPATMDALIRDQHWRIAHFRVAGDDINYRRFFDINDLAGLRMELPELFDHTHSLVLHLLEGGTLDGLRIDHIDGLFDPKAYLERLRGQAARPFYLVVEKILAHHESLREDWPVEGTTGYDFTNLVLALLLDPAAEESLTRIYIEFTGDRQSFAEIVQASKIRIMENEMASELHVLARDGARIARQNPRSADFTENILRRAIKEVVACFPVYRTYISGTTAPADSDRRDLDWAFGQARRYETNIDPSVFDFLQSLASTDLVAEPRSGFSRHSVVRFAMKLQQYSGPVMAKGLEDTAFYRYNRFLALNEVGGTPDRIGLTLAAFHRANELRATRWPHSMLATSTHDTKHGEDSRARLAVLADIPDEWGRQVVAWSRVLRAARGDVESAVLPDRNDEYAFYQLLLGSWPAELIGAEELDPGMLASYAQRLVTVMRKSLREAKLRTTWAMPEEECECGTLAFVEAALDPLRSGAFLTLFRPFAERVARLGIGNSLVQIVLKLTLPGMPDLYQGSELWDLNMVDPDNRRPVDYSLREKALAEVNDALARDRCGTVRHLVETWPDGRIKLALIATLLEYRRSHPDLFADGSYEPIMAGGGLVDRLCCFLRQRDDAAILVAVSRFPGASERSDAPADDSVPIPTFLRKARLRELLTDRAVPVENGAVTARQLFADLPVAVLVRT
jgi:(1->4)-alpha-D-glucan 1-alpha-D-glucosylmutase